MRSRYLHELTTPEAEAYFAGGGDIGILPVGCVEMHGPHQPIGTDTIIAEAFAGRIAELADGLVLPPIHYTWAGSTDGFVGTISIPSDLTMQLVEGVAVRAVAMGFKRLALLSIHGPNQMVLGLTARRLFEKLLVPVAYIDAYKPVNDEATKVFDEVGGEGKEASLVLAALEVLGRGTLYREADMNHDDQAPPMPPSYWAMRPNTLVGYYMQDPRQHACPSPHVSLERGRRFFDLQAAQLAKVFDSLADYAAAVSQQTNRGTRV